MRRYLLYATATLLLAATLANPVQAHAAGVPPGYDRVVHDCADDYGFHATGDASQRGHGLAAIDILEDTVDGTPMVLVRVTVTDQSTTDTAQTREQLSFTTPRKTGDDAINTVVGTPRNGDSDSITYVSGTEPAFMETGLEAYFAEQDGGGPDSGRFGFQLGYTYEQLQAENGDVLENFVVIGKHKTTTSSSFANGDRMPGSHFDGANDPQSCETSDQRQDLFIASYEIKSSNWNVKTGTESGTGDGGSGDGSGDSGDSGDAGSGNELPIADFAFAPSNPKTGDTITFTDDSVDKDGTIQSWDWDFGDGTTSTDQNPTHQYDDNGAYTAKLWVTDNDGGIGSIEKAILVANRAPSAAIGVPDHIDAGTDVTFHDDSTDPDGTIAAWSWDFGDGTTATEANPVHRYETAGTYTITLTVTDDDGASHTTTQDVTVGVHGAGEESPAPPFVVTTLLALAGLAALRRRT